MYRVDTYWYKPGMDAVVGSEPNADYYRTMPLHTREMTDTQKIGTLVHVRSPGYGFEPFAARIDVPSGDLHLPLEPAEGVNAFDHYMAKGYEELSCRLR